MHRSVRRSVRKGFVVLGKCVTLYNTLIGTMDLVRRFVLLIGLVARENTRWVVGGEWIIRAGQGGRRGLDGSGKGFIGRSLICTRTRVILHTLGPEIDGIAPPTDHEALARDYLSDHRQRVRPSEGRMRRLC